MNKKMLGMLIGLVGVFGLTIADERIDAANYLKNVGVTNKDPYTISFEEPVTRKESAVLMKRYALVQGRGLGQKCGYYEDTLSLPEKDEIYDACRVGLFKSAKNFYPNQHFTRGQLVMVLARFLNNNPWMELDESYNFLLSKRIIKVDDRTNSNRASMRSEVYLMLYRLDNQPTYQPTTQPMTTITTTSTSQFNNIVKVKTTDVIVGKPTFTSNVVTDGQEENATYTFQGITRGDVEGEMILQYLGDGTDIDGLTLHEFGGIMELSLEKVFGVELTHAITVNQYGNNILLLENANTSSEMGILIAMYMTKYNNQTYQFMVMGAWERAKGDLRPKMMNVINNIQVLGTNVFSNLGTNSIELSNQNISVQPIVTEKYIGNFQSIYQVTFPLDNQYYAFVAKKTSESPNIVVKDGLEIVNQYKNSISPVYSPDGSSFAYQGEKDNKWIIVKDGVEIGSDYVANQNPVYSYDSKKFGFIAMTKDIRNVIVSNGSEIGTYKRLGGFIYSPDGQNIAVETTNINGAKTIIKNGVEIIDNRYNQIYEPVYSPDGIGFAYIGFVNSNYEQIRKIIKDGNEISIKNGDDFHSPTYSSDGKDFIFAVRNPINKKWRVAIKDKFESGEYDLIANGLSYYSVTKTLSFIAKKNDTRYKVDIVFK